MQEEKQRIQQKRVLKRHTAKVAAGFLRFQVLAALNEKPLSGSELIENIEKNTGGFWKPSPGSIYPLLARLQGSDCIRELPTENGMKRYEINEKGKLLLEEQKKLIDEYSALSIQQTTFNFNKIPSEQSTLLWEAFLRGSKAIIEVSNALQKSFSKEAVDEIRKVMDESSEKLEKIAIKIKGEKNE